MRTKKWRSLGHADQATTLVARRALRQRLKEVLEHLDRVAKHGDKRESIEDIHQLRVATRRASAALSLFRDALPRRRRQQMKARLKELRSVAGEARDMDVMGLRLEQRLSNNERQSLAAVMEQVNRQRMKHRKSLRRAKRDARARRLSRRMKQLTQRVLWRGDRPEPSYRATACKALLPLVHQFLEAGKADLSDIENLHRMRLAGKKLRYAIELLAPAFDGKLRDEIYPLFADIQERLGTINDHCVAKAHFEDWRHGSEDPAVSNELTELIRLESDALREARVDFGQWWTPAASDRLSNQFARLLAGERTSSAEPPRKRKRRSGKNDDQHEAAEPARGVAGPAHIS